MDETRLNQAIHKFYPDCIIMDEMTARAFASKWDFDFKTDDDRCLLNTYRGIAFMTPEQVFKAFGATLLPGFYETFLVRFDKGSRVSFVTSIRLEG